MQSFSEMRNQRINYIASSCKYGIQIARKAAFVVERKGCMILKESCKKISVMSHGHDELRGYSYGMGNVR